MMLLDDAIGLPQNNPQQQGSTQQQAKSGLQKLNVPGVTTIAGQASPLPTMGTPQTSGIPSAVPQPTPAGTFDANNNLINRQYTSAPTSSPQYQAVSGPNYSSVDQVLAGIMNKSPGSYGGGVTFSYDPETKQLRETTLSQLEKALEGPDRASLASDAYSLMEERSRPEFENRVRQLGQQTAALGRVGSGIYGSNLTDLNAERERELGLNRRELANTAAGQTMSDRLAALDASRGVLGDFSDMNLRANQVTAAGAAGAARAYGDDFQNSLQLANFLAGLEDSRYGARVRERDTSYGAGRDQYGDALGERDYQYGLSQDALDEGYRRRGFEEDLTNSQFGREVQARSLEDELYGNEFNRGLDLYGVGAGNDPTGALRYQAGRYDDRAADAGDAFTELMGSYGARRQPVATRTPDGQMVYDPYTYG